MEMTAGLRNSSRNHSLKTQFALMESNMVLSTKVEAICERDPDTSLASLGQSSFEMERQKLRSYKLKF